MKRKPKKVVSLEKHRKRREEAERAKLYEAIIARAAHLIKPEEKKR